MSYAQILNNPNKEKEIQESRIIKYTYSIGVPFEKWTIIRNKDAKNIEGLEGIIKSLNTLLKSKNKETNKIFLKSKELYNILNREEYIKKGKSSLIEKVCARNAVNLLGYYGDITRRRVENPSIKKYKDINLNVDTAFEDSFKILNKRLEVMIKEKSNKVDRMYNLIGQLVFNYALYNLTAKGGTSKIEDLRNIKVGGVKLWKKMYHVNKDLLARFKIVLSDYYHQIRKYDIAKSFLGNVKQLTEEIRNSEWNHNINRVRAVEGMYKTRMSLIFAEE